MQRVVHERLFLLLVSGRQRVLQMSDVNDDELDQLRRRFYRRMIFAGGAIGVAAIAATGWLLLQIIESVLRLMLHWSAP